MRLISCPLGAQDQEVAGLGECASRPLVVLQEVLKAAPPTSIEITLKSRIRYLVYRSRTLRVANERLPISFVSTYWERSK